MPHLHDTPPVYVYDGLWGMTAFGVLRLIQYKRRKYPELKAKCEEDRARFLDQLARYNEPVYAPVIFEEGETHDVRVQDPTGIIRTVKVIRHP
jgi:hypothetical protein